jgi:hypothetical protein
VQFQPVVQKNEDGTTELASKQGSEEEKGSEEVANGSTHGAAANGASEKVPVTAGVGGAQKSGPTGRQQKAKGRPKRR